MKRILIILTVLCFAGLSAQVDQSKGKHDPCVISNFTKSQVDCNTWNFTATSTSNSTTTIVGYFWDFGDGSTSTQQNPTHNYSSNGTYTVSLTTVGLTDSGVCCSHKKTMQVTVDCTVSNCGTVVNFQDFNAMCSPWVTYVIPSGGVIINSGWTITSYDWTFVANNGYTVTATGSNPTVNLSDVYCNCPWAVTLEVTATNGSGTTCVISRTENNHSGGSDLATGCFTDNEDIEYLISPNPIQDNIYIQTNTPIKDKTTMIEVKLFDYYGTLQQTRSFNAASSNWEIPVSHLPRGIYFTHIISNNKLVDIKKVLLK